MEEPARAPGGAAVLTLAAARGGAATTSATDTVLVFAVFTQQSKHRAPASCQISCYKLSQAVALTFLLDWTRRSPHYTSVLSWQCKYHSLSCDSYMRAPYLTDNSMVH